ncbi:MAG: HAMP domain-containing sensor histidine kinase [Marinoscillum sp.]
MKNTPIRFLVILGSLSMVAILGVQIFWVTQAIDKQEELFNRSVQMAMRNVVEALCEINGNDIPSNDPIDQLSSNYFIARTNYRIDLNSLDYLLKAELQKRNIDLDYEYGVYDCQSDRMVYGDFVTLENTGGKVKPTGKLPKLVNDEYYFGIYFPGKTAGLVNSLGIWKVTSALILVILVFFSYALVVILKQKRLSEIQRDFINNMTHEFKTPLATLQVSAEVLQNEVKEARQQKYTAIIRAELSRLEQHVHQLLETSVLDHEKSLQKKPVRVKEIANRVIKKFEDLDSKRLVVENNITENTQVLGDSVIFETLLFNLLDNANKYGESEIGFRLNIQKNKLTIAVQNDGQMIPKKEQAKIFQKFYRINKGDLHDVKGFGLGLYFVKQSVRSMKGDVHLESQDGHTIFTIKIPLYHE